MNHSALRYLIAFILLVLFADCAHAAGDIEPQTMASHLTTLYTKVFEPLDRFRALLSKNAGVFVLSLMVIHVAVGGIMLAAGTTDLFDLYLKGIKLAFVGGLVYSAVTPQPWLATATGTNADTLPAVIMNGMMKLVTTAVEAGGGFKHFDASNSLNKAVDSTLISNLLNTLMGGLVKLLQMEFLSKNWLKALTEALDPATWIAFLFWGASIIMYVLASGVLLMELIGAELTIKFALAFTPILVPWLLFKPMEFLFNGWLRSLIIGGLAYVISILLVSGFIGFVTTCTELIAQQKGQSWTQFNIAMLCLPLFLGSFMFFMMASKAMNIAQGLISGSGTDGISVDTFRRAMGAVGAGAASAGKVRGGAANVAAAGMPLLSAGGSALKAAAVAGGQAKGDVASRGGNGIAQAKAAAMSGGASILGSAVRGVKQKVSTDGSPSSALKASAGGKAVTSIASAQGQMPTPREFSTAAKAYNSTASSSRAQGLSAGEAAAKGNSVVKQILGSAPKEGSGKRPESPTEKKKEPPAMSFPSVPTK